MAKHKNNADFRRRYSEKRGHYKHLFDWTVLGIVALIALAALAVDLSNSALCGETSGGFAGWFLVVIGYVPLLLHALLRVFFGEDAAVIPVQVWHLALVDFSYVVLLWGVVRLIARRHSSEFLRRAWHIALFLFCWGAFQLTVCAGSALWHQGGMPKVTPQYLQNCDNVKIMK